MTYESVLQHDIKPFGRWQLQTFVLFLLPNTISIVLLLRYANISPPVICAGYGQGWTFAALRNFSTSIANFSGLTEIDFKCHRFSFARKLRLNISSSNAIIWVQNQLLRDPDFLNNSDLEACEPGDWRYDQDNAVFRNSLIETFDLVCYRQYLIPLASVVFCIGSIIGSSLGGALGDTFGRKRVLCVIQPMVSIILCLLYFCNSFWLFVTSYFLLGLIAPVSYTVGYILCTELTDYHHRNTFGLLDGISTQIIGHGTVILTSYLTQDWRFVLLIVGIIYTLSFVYPCMLFESPKWLIAEGQYETALKTIRTGILINGNSKARRARSAAITEQDIRLSLCMDQTPSDDPSCCQSLANTTRSYHDFLTNPLSRRRWIPLLFICFLSNLTYFSVTFYIVRLDFNAYIVGLFGVILAIPSKALRWVLYRFFDRKWPLVASFFIQAGLCVIAFIIFLFSTSSLAVVILMTVAFSLNSSALEMLHIYIPELFLTLHRSNASGFLGAINGIGVAVGMFVERFDDFMWKPLPLLIFVACHFVSGLCTMTLPKSDPAKMPDSYKSEREMNITDSRELQRLETTD